MTTQVYPATTTTWIIRLVGGIDAHAAVETDQRFALPQGFVGVFDFPESDPASLGVPGHGVRSLALAPGETLTAPSSSTSSLNFMMSR